MFGPAKIERDAEGYWIHPTFEDLPENSAVTDHPQAEGMEFRYKSLEYDNDKDWDRYCEANSPDISYWNPTLSDGDGWFLVAIFDTDGDGPYACFARQIRKTFRSK